MKNNPIGWFEIYVQDMERAKAFYEAVFEGKLESLGGSSPMEYWTFPMSYESYGAAGALVKMEGVPSGGNTTVVYFHCLDCAVEAARAAENGGSIFKEKMSIGEHGFMALVLDTEGNMIGLHSMN
jgi:hypothetical protein